MAFLKMTLNFLTKRKQKPGSQSLLKDLKKLISVPSSVLFFGVAVTGKSFSDALILASTNPQYDKRLFIELP